MKLRPIAVAFAALFSSAALAGGAGHPQSQAQPDTSASSAQSSSQGSSSMSSASAETVKQAQEKLAQEGQDPGPADGVLGPKTQAALKDFQQKNNLEASGKLDQDTLAALEIDQSGGSSSTGSSSAPSSQGSSSDSGKSQ